MKREFVKASDAIYQSFSAIGGPIYRAEHVRMFRAELARRALDGFVVPRADEHQNEYVPLSAERLQWLTGFTGSAGLAIVLKERAALFVDGRYSVQAREQIDPSVFTAIHIADISPNDWIEANLSRGDRLGYDPWLHTPEIVEGFEKACNAIGAAIAPVEGNPVDAVWSDRPKEPRGAVTIHPFRFSGEGSVSKIARVQGGIRRADGMIISDAHCVSWLFNIRGADIAHTPLALSFAYVPKSGTPTLFIDGRKLSNSVRARLSAVARVEEPATLVGFIECLGSRKSRILFDSSTAPSKLTKAHRDAGGEPVIGPDAIALMKARKNRIELEGARAANVRDGVAMVRFLASIDRELKKGAFTEISAATALEGFRRRTGRLKDISFPTIAAAGRHSAIPHYRVTEASNLKIERGLFLIDSGGQYRDGTTDITRTISVGRPSAFERDRFTRVLKGHIEIACAVFPKGTTGAQIDSFARKALWRAGADFEHGTGHGVGSYLSVHEGPQRIAKTGFVALEAGMILSNEPGYYAEGRFGIRIENLVVVEPRAILGAEREMLGFETISLAPIDLKIVDPELLDSAEVKWLNIYHARVRATLSPLVDRETRAWLVKATRKLTPLRTN